MPEGSQREIKKIVERETKDFGNMILYCFCIAIGMGCVVFSLMTFIISMLKTEKVEERIGRLEVKEERIVDAMYLLKSHGAEILDVDFVEEEKGGEEEGQKTNFYHVDNINFYAVDGVLVNGIKVE